MVQASPILNIRPAPSSLSARLREHITFTKNVGLEESAAAVCREIFEGDDVFVAAPSVEGPESSLVTLEEVMAG